jgi:phosphate transport system protein
MDIEHRVEAMGKFARDMLVDGARALITHDVALARAVLGRRERLAAFDEKIESVGIEELVRGVDPQRSRRLAALLKIITSLNRIGRYGADLCHATLAMRRIPPRPVQKLGAMAADVDAMVATVLEGLRGEPIESASLLALEDEVDAADKSVRIDVVEALQDPDADTQALVELALASRILERCGDHACRMAEKLHAATLGERVLYR